MDELFVELLFAELYACAHLFASGSYYPAIREESKFGQI